MFSILPIFHAKGPFASKLVCICAVDESCNDLFIVFIDCTFIHKHLCTVGTNYIHVHVYMCILMYGAAQIVWEMCVILKISMLLPDVLVV